MLTLAGAVADGEVAPIADLPVHAPEQSDRNDTLNVSKYSI
jgi:hypothetical protein